MFKRIELGNFKRFQRDSVDLKKINIVVGPNNSGKSSLLGAFRLICQTLDSFDDEVPLLLNGPFGDFGTFKDLVYKNHRGRPLELSFDIEVPSIRSIVASAAQPTSLISFNLVFKYSQEEREIYAQSIEIELDKHPLIKLKYSMEGRRHNVESIGSTEIPSTLKNSISREFRIRHFIPIPSAVKLGIFEQDRNTTYAQFTQSFNTGPDAESIRFLSRLSSRVSSFIRRVDYLGPLRTAPARTYLFSGERSKRIGVGGENMTSLLATKDKKRPRDKDKGDDTQGSGLGQKINAWLQKSEMAHSATLTSISDRHFEIRVKNFFTREDQNIADVGYGHSQVLPFLAGGYSMGAGSVYIAEQPELHLHPKAQAELGDYVLDLYEAGTQLLIETHSEHLILRLQQHVANESISCEDIRIFYVCNDLDAGDMVGPKKEIIPIDMDNQGQFKQRWPKGFFPEKLEESKKLARIRMTQLNLKL